MITLRYYWPVKWVFGLQILAAHSSSVPIGLEPTRNQNLLQGHTIRDCKINARYALGLFLVKILLMSLLIGIKKLLSQENNRLQQFSLMNREEKATDLCHHCLRTRVVRWTKSCCKEKSSQTENLILQVAWFLARNWTVKVQNVL